MTITFDDNDAQIIRQKLEGAGIGVSDARVQEVLYNVEAAFGQQFDYEADYMINEFEADN